MYLLLGTYKGVLSMHNPWFTQEELDGMTIPTMDQVIKLIQEKEYDQAKKLCGGIKKEWSFLHRLMAESYAALIDFIDTEYKEFSGKTILYVYERVWKNSSLSIRDETRKKAAQYILKNWADWGLDTSILSGRDTFSLEKLKMLTTPQMEKEIIESMQVKSDQDVIKMCIISKHEWGLLHDLLVESIAACLTIISESLGEKYVGVALKKMTEKVWKQPIYKMESLARKQIAVALAGTWRAHSTGGVGEEVGGFRMTEDEEKITFELSPCGSGQRLWRRGLTDNEKKYGFTKEEHFWSFNRSDFPYYCSHCTYMNEIMPIEWTGTPIYPLDPPASPEHPCKWYFYKNQKDVPERFYERYNYKKRTTDIVSVKGSEIHG